MLKPDMANYFDVSNVDLVWFLGSVCAMAIISDQCWPLVDLSYQAENLY